MSLPAGWKTLPKPLPEQKSFFSESIAHSRGCDKFPPLTCDTSRRLRPTPAHVRRSGTPGVDGPIRRDGYFPAGAKEILKAIVLFCEVSTRRAPLEKALLAGSGAGYGCVSTSAPLSP